MPPVTWTPPPSGGAFAALLGLVGTGLEGEFQPEARSPGGKCVAPCVLSDMSATSRIVLCQP